MLGYSLDLLHYIMVKWKANCAVNSHSSFRQTERGVECRGAWRPGTGLMLSKALVARSGPGTTAGPWQPMGSAASGRIIEWVVENRG